MALRRRLLQAALALITVCGAVGVLAQEGGYECRLGELLRQVTIVYEMPGEAVPCRVRYSKPTEDIADQVLWRATSESGYCEFKAKEFRAQLESWGWSCTGAEPEAEADEQLGDSAPPAPPANLGDSG